VKYNKIFFILPIFIFITTLLFSQSNSSASSSKSSDKSKSADSQNNNAKTQDDEEWLNNYINIDPTDDLLNGFKLKGYKISKAYVENLQWNQEIKLYIDDIDKYNLRKNINILPRFPYVFMLFGGFDNGRGFDPGFLFRADNFLDTRSALTLGFSYAQNGKMWTFANFEYPVLLQNRLKVFGTLGYFTTYPQASSYIDSFQGTDLYPVTDGAGNWVTSSNFPNQPATQSNFLNKVFNKIWKTFDIPFYRQVENGIDAVGGFDYRIPLVELNTITSAKFTFKYDSWRVINIHKSSYLYGSDVGENVYKENGDPQDIDFINTANIGLNLREELRWDQLKQTSTIATGYYLSYAGDFYLPTSGYLPFFVQEPNSQFRVKNRIEGKFIKKILREFSVRSRLLVDINYNISEDFSGDPYVRGLASQELTGWFACLANLVLYVPVVNIDMHAAGDVPFNKDAKFLVYLDIFSDLGFTIENYNFYLENAIERRNKGDIKNALFPYNLDKQLLIGEIKNASFPYNADKQITNNNNYLLPAVTFGAGLRIYPYFLPFIIRFDAAFNLLKTIEYGDASQSFELIFSFNEMF
jgi:hypothetical protein